MTDVSFGFFPISHRNFSLSQSGKAGTGEQQRSFSDESAVQYSFTHPKLQCVLCREQEGLISGRSCELWGFFCCTWQKPVFHSTNIGWASPSAHREGWLWPLCGAICLLPRCGIKQMSCAADQTALWRSQQEFLVLSPQKEQCVSYCWEAFGWRGVNF